MDKKQSFEQIKEEVIEIIDLLIPIKERRDELTHELISKLIDEQILKRYKEREYTDYNFCLNKVKENETVKSYIGYLDDDMCRDLHTLMLKWIKIMKN